MPENIDENAIIIEAWNTVLFEKFVRFRHLLTKGLSSHSDEVFRRRPFASGARVLDVGCGFADTTLAIARMVGPNGHAVGIDCSENFIRSAEKDAGAAGIENASFLVADVQSDDLRGPYEYAFSRFGTMFCPLPGAAMRNIRRRLLPGGRLTMIVWRRREDNLWLYEAERRVREMVTVVSHDETDQVHCGPGPFSMAGPDTVSDMLRSAGFEQINFERFDRDMCIGRDLEEAVDFAMALGPTGEILRLAGEEGVKRQDDVAVALHEVFRSFERDDGVWAHSSVWFVSATNPSGQTATSSPTKAP